MCVVSEVVVWCVRLLVSELCWCEVWFVVMVTTIMLYLL